MRYCLSMVAFIYKSEFIESGIFFQKPLLYNKSEFAMIGYRLPNLAPEVSEASLSLSLCGFFI